MVPTVLRMKETTMSHHYRFLW